MNPENFQRITTKLQPDFRPGSHALRRTLHFLPGFLVCFYVPAVNCLLSPWGRGEVRADNVLKNNSNHTVNYKRPLCPALEKPVIPIKFTVIKNNPGALIGSVRTVCCLKLSGMKGM